jgi:protein-tyrosine phosphatase
LRHAGDAIETLHSDGTLLVTCALGYGRSAAAIAAWLVQSGRATDTAAALATLRAARPRVTLDTAALTRALDRPLTPVPVPVRQTP